MPPNPPSAIAAYLRKRAVTGPWSLEPFPSSGCIGAVVVPALAECANLHATLKSLAANPPVQLERFLFIVVVNNRCDASAEEREDNRLTLANLRQWGAELSLPHLCRVDAASPGRELPAKDGVGLARKIGLDLALPHLDHATADPLLICLDADTLVEPAYLEALTAHFAGAAAGGASIPYRHQPAASPAGQAAIDRYELFLRSYVLGLAQAGSPYAFHTVGSAMGCSASAYAAAGGMNRRQAGEDFYFLQQVHKVAGVAEVAGTCVYPSPRASRRVPFGTGRSVGAQLAKGEGELLFYRPELFAILGEWLETVKRHGHGGGDGLVAAAGLIEPHMAEFLRQAGFEAAWENMVRHSRDEGRLLTAFHGWFDAFRTMRLMHHLTDHGYPRLAPEAALPPLLARSGYTGCPAVAVMLAWLRQRDGAG